MSSSSGIRVVWSPPWSQETISMVISEVTLLELEKGPGSRSGTSGARP
jgi:hypothetical protein